MNKVSRMNIRAARIVPSLLVIMICLSSVMFIYVQCREAGPAEPHPKIVISNNDNDDPETIYVRPGGNLQGALNRARPGDEVVLEAGAEYRGLIVLPNKRTASEAWITIRSSRAGELPAGVRVSPADAPKMARIVSPGYGNQALRTEAGAHHYRLIGLEVAPVTPGATTYSLIELGGTGDSQDSLAEVPHHLSIERCYVHGHSGHATRRGVALNSAHTDIMDSYFSEFKGGEDTQAVMGWNGPGPFRIVNNYLEAAGENLLFGGSDPSVPNLVPSDITIERNHLRKPLEWRTDGRWTIKNLFELKSARRVRVVGNTMENNWSGGQIGYAIQLTVRNQDGGAPWSEVSDVEMTHNLVVNSERGINILGKDNYNPSVQTRRINIEHNVFVNRDGAEFQGEFLQLTETDTVTIRHNTILMGFALRTYGAASTNFVMSDNLFARGGMNGGGVGGGTVIFDTYFPGAVVERNVFGGLGQYAHQYQGWVTAANRLTPQHLTAADFPGIAAGDYRLIAGSPHAGLGADIAANEAARGGQLPPPTPQPTPTPTPPPSPQPTPTPTSGWVFCANENQRCVFTGVRTVRYGNNGVYSTRAFTDGVDCSNRVFGDPIPGVVKRCEVGEVIQPTPTPSPKPTPVLTPYGYYQFKAGHSEKCLDVRSAAQANGAAVIQWDCRNVENQQWQLIPSGDGYYQIVARHSGKALDLSGASMNNSMGFVQYDRHGGGNQQFEFTPSGDGYFRVVVRHSGKALDVLGNSVVNGVPVVQSTQHDGMSQQWFLSAVR